MEDRSTYRQLFDTPDRDFSPKRNKIIIERTIKKYEDKQREKFELFRNGIGERSEAVVSFWKHIDQKGSGDINRYFTPKMLAHLRGADIIDSLRNKLNVISRPSPIYIGDGLVKNSKGVIVGREVSNVKKKLQRQKKLG
jgi:hypothetical protein